MRIEIKTQQLERIVGLSRYNFNLYELPASITIDGCYVILDERGVTEEFVNYQLGRLENYKFVSVYWLNVEEIDFDAYESLTIDSETMTTENNWT